MPLERIGPSVAFDGRPVSVPSAAHVYGPNASSQVQPPLRSPRRPNSMGPPRPEINNHGMEGVPNLTRSSSSGSAYSLRSFGGRTSDILGPLEPKLSSSAPGTPGTPGEMPPRPPRRSRLASPLPVTSTSPPPLSPNVIEEGKATLSGSSGGGAPLLSRSVFSIGKPRSRQGNVDLLDVPSAQAPSHPPPKPSPSSKAMDQRRPELLAPPRGMVPSPPSLSPPASPPLPPAAPAPSPATLPMRQMGRRPGPSLHPPASSFMTVTPATPSSHDSTLPAPAPNAQTMLAPSSASAPASTSTLRRKRLPSEPAPLVLTSPPLVANRTTRASISAISDSHPLPGLSPVAPPANRRRHSGRFLARTILQNFSRAPRFPGARRAQDDMRSGSASPRIQMPSSDERDVPPSPQEPDTPQTPTTPPGDPVHEHHPDDQACPWGHVVPSLGTNFATHPLSSLSTPSGSPSSRTGSVSLDHAPNQTDDQSNPALCIDSLIARLHAAVASGAETAVPVPGSSPPNRRVSQGLVLRTPTTSELSMFLARQEGQPGSASKNNSGNGNGKPKDPPSLDKVEEEDDSMSSGKPSLEFHARGSGPARTLVPQLISTDSNAKPSRPLSPVPDVPDNAHVVPFQAKPAGEKRDINEYHILREIGRGAYGVVQSARLKDPFNGRVPTGKPQEQVGETVVIKYIVKSRILADCWRRHRTLGTIPTEIHVMDQLRRLSYRAPLCWPPWSPERLFPQLFDSPLPTPAESLARDQSVELGSTLYHPNLAHMLDFFEDAEYYYLVMRRFGQGQDVFDFVEGSAGGVSMVQVRCIAGQLACALVFLHEHGIVHRDIKDENVILSGPTLHAQLIDFGSAAHRSRATSGAARKKFDTFSGTLEYAAAEILRGQRYEGPAQDIWALGVVLYVLLCGECPFWNGEEALGALHDPQSRPAQTLRKRLALGDIAPWSATTGTTGATEANPAPPTSTSPEADRGTRDQGQADGGGTVAEAIDLISLCLSLEPRDRPTARQVCLHRFFAGCAGWTGPSGWTKLEPHWGEQWLGPVPPE